MHIKNRIYAIKNRKKKYAVHVKKGQDMQKYVK